MGVTQVLNSKAVIKKITANDLPFSPAQPVMSSYYATSTAGQTVINLSFSMQASGVNTNTDAFWLFIDGRKFDLGAGNDYTFTSIGSDGTSAQVTLNQPIPANLNIQAFKMGLKSELEFGVDNRFVQLYAYENAGFQGFISPTNTVINATATTGTPVAGTFYTTIVNRAPMIDLSQDMKARMGIDRIMFQSVQLVQNEFGPNGESVWSTPNDQFGQIRFIGNWSNATDVNGARPVSSGVANVDSLEITFYGTGLNILTLVDTNARPTSYSVDGSGLTAITPSTTTSTIPQGRNYATNTIVKVVNGLALGVHTVRIVATGSVNITPYGVEVLNESSNVTVNPGVGFIQNKLYTSSAASVFAFNSVATGTRGGRVLVYQNGDGTIGKAWQAVNASSALLTSADHTNEEVARTYRPREFGAGRLDDFSRIGTAGVAAAFTLDDGCTSLSTTSAVFQTLNGSEGVAFSAAANSFIFTFVGTGLDIQVSTNAIVGTFTYSVDGSTAASIPFSGTGVVNTKIVSGLPYGSHTFKLTLSTVTSGQFSINNFTVYQPKKPTVPAGTVEIADYNVMATFSTSTLNDSTINGILQVATGALLKPISREWLFTGANWAFASSPYPSGLDASTSTNNGQTASYTFFGTGAVLTVENSSGGTFSVQVNVDGSLFATATALQNMTNAGGGTYTTTTSTTQIPGRIAISGLTLGVHTVTINRSAGTGSFFFDDIQIAVPIHSYKSNLFQDLQNTLPVGSQSISDNRQTTPIKSALPSQKAWTQAVGITAGPTTGAAGLTPMPDMSCTIKTSGGSLLLLFEGIFQVNSNFGSLSTQFYIDGVAVGGVRQVNVPGVSENELLINMQSVSVAPGFHKVDVYWGNVGNGATTATASGTERSLIVREF